MPRIWRKNFSLKRFHPQIIYETAKSFYDTHRYLKIPYILKEIIMVNESEDNTGYFLVRELRKVIDVILNKIIKNPTSTQDLNKKIIKYHKESFDFIKSCDNRNFQKIKKKNLYKMYKKLYDLMARAHASALTTNWLVDSDHQDFSRFLLKYLEKQIKKLGLNLHAANIFSVLTTPLLNSFNRNEEIEMLELIKLIYKNPVAQKIFKNIKPNFNSLPNNIKNKILTHYKKWRWLPYTYIGPAYEFDYYLETISSFVRQKADINKLLLGYKKSHKINKEKQKKLYKDLKITDKFRTYFEIARDSVYVKEYRKSCMYYGYYVMDKILCEIARRLSISLAQARYFTIDEAKKAILAQKFDVNEVDKRMEFFVLHARCGRIKIFVGKKAKEFLKKQKFEEEKLVDVRELKGICASPGKVAGRTSIVNFREEIKKIKEGEIMASHTTFPALVPAMKKASAIITEDGGITCHAAIVSRELKKPCVVGIKNMLDILKDGDRIQVDAENGIIKILK